MLIDFFFTLRDARVPVSIKEFLTLLEALEKNVIAPSLDDFYYLARLTLVKWRMLCVSSMPRHRTAAPGAKHWWTSAKLS